MDLKVFFDSLLKGLESSNRTALASRLSLIRGKDGSLEYLFSQPLGEGSEQIPSESLKIPSDRNAAPVVRTVEISGRQLTCSILPLPSAPDTWIVIQGGESPASQDMFQLAGSILGMLPGEKAASHVECDDGEKYRTQLIRMREMQARLFPKFTAVKDLDIASVFLPSELMSGNFVDGFFIDESTYQVVTCIVSGYDAASSFAGAAIRTLVRSESPRKMVPSLLIDTITTKMKNIVSGIHSLIYLTVFQINIPSGKVILSSFGDLTTLFYNSKKKGYVDLKNTEAGRLMAKRNFFRDISLMLEPGDIILYYSKGTLNTSTEDGSTLYGDQRLVEQLLKNREAPSLELVHSVSESLFEFSDYTPSQEDILLVSIRRPVSTG